MKQTNRLKFRFKIAFDTEIQQVTKAELASVMSNFPFNAVIISDLVFMKRHSVFFRSIPISIPVLPIEVKSNTKNLQELNLIYEFLLKERVQRNMTVFVFGGGTLTDLAAFAVSTFKRGVHLELIPTTVVGMVDASLGGKTAFDIHHLKNMIGTFYPASVVYFCHDFLKSIEPVDILNGWAEIVKIYLIHKEMELPEKLDINYLPPKEVIWEAAKLKMAICASDLRDREGRRMLNLGHSFAHVLESISLCDIPHGIAVVFGIHAAALLSFRLSRINEKTMNRIRNLFHDFPLAEYVTEELIHNVQKDGIDALSQDKKAEHDVKLVLFTDWRELEIVDVDDSDKALNALVDVLKQQLTCT